MKLQNQNSYYLSPNWAECFSTTKNTKCAEVRTLPETIVWMQTWSQHAAQDTKIYLTYIFIWKLFHSIVVCLCLVHTEGCDVLNATMSKKNQPVPVSFAQTCNFDKST